jgi:hypothetical protein
MTLYQTSCYSKYFLIPQYSRFTKIYTCGRGRGVPQLARSLSCPRCDQDRPRVPFRRTILPGVTDSVARGEVRAWRGEARRGEGVLRRSAFVWRAWWVVGVGQELDAAACGCADYVPLAFVPSRTATYPAAAPAVLPVLSGTAALQQVRCAHAKATLHTRRLQRACAVFALHTPAYAAPSKRVCMARVCSAGPPTITE